MSNNRLQDLLDLSYVPRWCVVPIARPQSVAEHSYRVAVIAMDICRKINGEDLLSAGVIESHVILWALVHDAPESETGDLPSTVKDFDTLGRNLKVLEAAKLPWLGRMVMRTHPIERAIVGIADKVEAILWIRQWGVGAKARLAEERDTAILRERVEEARSKFGLSLLPEIVAMLIDSGLRPLGSLELGSFEPGPPRT